VARTPLILLAGLLAAPAAGLAVLVAAPDADVQWEHHPSHFWLTLSAAALSSALAYATGVAARRRGDGRVYLSSLGFLAAAGFLGLHALATPGVLLDSSNVGFAISTPIGLVVAGGLAAASALDLEGEWGRRVTGSLGPLQHALIAVMAAWAVLSLTLMARLDDVPERASGALIALAVLGVGLYGFAVVRYVRLWRARRSPLLLGFAAAFVLLGEATVATAIGRSWHASWWEWHVLMLAAFALIASSAHREWHEERFSGLYLDKTAEATRQVSVLFADLQGFTAYSERHEASAVTEMLNTLFEAAIPAIERHGGEIDRLIGDAVMATFNRRGDQDDHAQRAGRAALALQEAAAVVAAVHPEWPRFRAGLNTGEASVGVLGSGRGRTYSVIGDTVNLAARIEGLAPAGGVAISAETATRLVGASTQPLGDVQVKGREAPVAVYLLLSVPP
jgi:class 3 adenylate cyclase